MPDLILASSSPYRRELLTRLRLPFESASPDIDESHRPGESAEELVRRLTGRGTESSEEQQRRLETAKVELAAQDEFDAKVVNREVGQAAAEVVELMNAPFRATTSR